MPEWPYSVLSNFGTSHHATSSRCVARVSIRKTICESAKKEHSATFMIIDHGNMGGSVKGQLSWFSGCFTNCPRVESGHSGYPRGSAWWCRFRRTPSSCWARKATPNSDVATRGTASQVCQVCQGDPSRAGFPCRGTQHFSSLFGSGQHVLSIVLSDFASTWET